MSRSLGDAHAHRLGVSSKPSLNTHRIEETEIFLILASDGVWGVMENNDVALFVEDANKVCT